MRNPVQPQILVDGVLRFKENKIVSWLLENSSKDMNDIACEEFSVEDRQQFAQLIGYSVSGYSSLDYVDDYSHGVAEIITTLKVTEDQARITYLETLVNTLRKALREPMAILFDVHPDDLLEE